MIPEPVSAGDVDEATSEMAEPDETHVENPEETIISDTVENEVDSGPLNSDGPPVSDQDSENNPGM